MSIFFLPIFVCKIISYHNIFFSLLRKIFVNFDFFIPPIRLQRRLLQLHKGNLLHTNLSKLFRPTDFQQSRMYGLPKTHKKRWTTPTYPVYDRLSATQAGQIFLLSNRFLTLYSCNCISNSFTFAGIMKTSKLDFFYVFHCFFDVSNLFMNLADDSSSG